MLPLRYDLTGYSTHLSVELPDALTAHVAHLFAQSFAPALMLLMDQRDTPGLLCRPRPGRLELGGDYAKGDDLRAALLMALGGVLACVARIEREPRGAVFPPLVRVAAEWGVDRFGWYVERTAFGADLYASGRRTMLQRRSRRRRRIEAQQQLEACWRSAERALGELISSEERRLMEARITGAVELPCEHEVDEAPEYEWSAPRPSPHGLAARSWRRPRYDVEAVAATWDFCVLRIRGARDLYLNVPRADFETVGCELDEGLLDARVNEGLAGAGARTLSRAEQTTKLGFYDVLDGWVSLAAREPVRLETLTAAGALR